MDTLATLVWLARTGMWGEFWGVITYDPIRWLTRRLTRR
jgi:hypothetical protein